MSKRFANSNFLSIKTALVCNEYDYNKLRLLMHHTHGAMDIEAIIGIDDFSRMATFVDALFAVHPNMRSHIGGTITFGVGVFILESQMQKLNTKSSTDAEIVGASGILPVYSWKIRVVQFKKI